MANLDALYREILLEYAGRPNPVLDETKPIVRVYNRSCGDAVQISYDNRGKALKVTVHATGCIICRASAVMLESLVNDHDVSLPALVQAVKEMITTGRVPALLAESDLAALAGVAQFPARVACAYLAWEGLAKALHDQK